MKGKNTFTNEEANKITALIDLKVKSDTAKQKAIRAKIRALGFYASDFPSIKKGYTVNDFRGVVKIKD